MNSYNIFASLYDALTENVDYQVRSDYISGFFKAQNINGGTLVELGCGTGSFAECFIKKGFNIVGVDLSQQMLTIAQNKLSKYSNNFTLINSKMQDFESHAPADAVICCLDSINHLTNEKDVIKTFSNVYNYLKNNGLFVFDVNTIYKHQNILFNNTFVFDEDNYYLVWDNEPVDDREVRIMLDFFMFNGVNYDRYSEEFNERAYSSKELIKMLNQAGFSDIKIYDELTTNNEKENSERLYFVCKK